MATTAIWKVKGNLGRVVGYAANPDKTPPLPPRTYRASGT